MKRTRHSAEQIVTKLREAKAMLAAGKTVAQVVQALGVSEQTFSRWRNQYGGMREGEAAAEGTGDRKRAAEEGRGGPDDRQPDPQGGQRLPGKAASPARQRCVVTHVRAKLNKPERRVCRVLGQARSTQRYAAIPRDGDEHLVRRMHELVRLHPQRGYRMILGMLRLEGWRVNRKRVHRLWRQEGLKVPGIQHKRTRLGHSRNGIVCRRAEHKDHVWALDFIHDTDARGGPLKRLGA